MKREMKIKCKSCGACCIAPSISSSIPGLENGKMAGERCIHLSQENLCLIYEKRPLVCREYSPNREICGENQAEAITNLTLLEKLTSPDD